MSSRLKLADIIAQRTLKSGNSKKFSQEIAAYLLETGQVDELSSVIRDIQAIWSDQGHVEVIARSAYPIDAAATAEITKSIKSVYPNAKQVIINEVRDENILSGVKLDLANLQLDLSAESKLNKFRQLTASGKE
jgi:F0F1-type ATP synthase delta subunit